MNSPKRHHYVPDSYLAGFTEPGSAYAHIFSKQTSSFRRQRTNQVAVVGQYYRQDHAPDGVDKNVLEKHFGQEVEPKGMEALRQLSIAPGSLGEEGMADFLQYLELQRIRVPRQLDQVRLSLEADLIARILSTPEISNTLNNRQLTIKESIRFEVLRNSVGLLIPYFSKMRWEIIEAAPGSSFITSDSPVSFQNPEILPPMEPGIAMYGTRVLFPLTKQRLLLLQYPQYLSKEKAATELLAEGQMVEDGSIEIVTGQVWSARKVEIHNRVMFFLAQDIIVGENEDVVRLASGN